MSKTKKEARRIFHLYQGNPVIATITDSFEEFQKEAKKAGLFEEDAKQCLKEGPHIFDLHKTVVTVIAKGAETIPEEA